MMSKVIWIYLAGSEGKKAQIVIGIVYLFLFVFIFWIPNPKIWNIFVFYFLLFYFICCHFLF